MASKYLQKFPVPKDFQNILHDFAREILRDQPQDLIEYSFLYFNALENHEEFDYPRKGLNIPPPKIKKTSNQEVIKYVNLVLEKKKKEEMSNLIR